MMNVASERYRSNPYACGSRRVGGRPQLVGLRGRVQRHHHKRHHIDTWHITRAAAHHTRTKKTRFLFTCYDMAWLGMAMRWHGHGYAMAWVWPGMGMRWHGYGMAMGWLGYGMAMRLHGYGLAMRWLGYGLAWLCDGMGMTIGMAWLCDGMGMGWHG